MNALEMTTAVHTIAVAIAADLSNEDLELLATVLSQISSVFATILVQRGVQLIGGDEALPMIVSHSPTGLLASAP